VKRKKQKKKAGREAGANFGLFGFIQGPGKGG
jgi:hypothetical protein